MEYLSEEHLKFLLHKEWLVKIDNNKSVPYLFKFYSSTVDQCCYLMISDTKASMGRSKQFARRWRDCNPSHAPPPTLSDEDEDEWRSNLLGLLSDIHSLGGITDLLFDVVDSRNADFAFELGSDDFKWRWETYSLGPKVAADTLSKHLIMPLISVTHLAFSSADPVSELSEADLAKTVDKIGRTARRTLDTHVKHAISRPRVATTLRRMTAMFNFLPDLPPVLSDVDVPELKPPEVPQQSRTHTKAPHRGAGTIPPPPVSSARLPSEASSSRSGVEASSARINKKKATPEDSETEKSSGEDRATAKTKIDVPSGSEQPSRQGTTSRVASTSVRAESPQDREMKPSKTSEPESSPDSRPSVSSPRPAKKAKRVQESSSSDEDSDAGPKRRAGPSTRGAKQPLKRGGRRF
ncbi:hypothetical protein NM688_g2433 [Phlebia brevispora]|uniref:Uncharacterized protein n=1 Tax=Phlebia brevispora TaxID=194682 RepID=A0ACC1T9A3_9APHY|nr:hypothetical protein NM688_g2433 [Phlebia brevispora]